MKNKKVLGYIIAVVVALLPALYLCINILNVTDYEKINLEDYNTMNLSEILEQEEIESKLGDYKESDDQVVIYLFRGNGCTYCRAFLNYLNGLDAEMLNKIKVVGFESWYDEANYNLLSSIGETLGQEAEGVPYIIIGDQVFPGYAESYDADIEAKIEELYAQDPEDRYDAFEAHNEALAKTAREEVTSKYSPVIVSYVMILLATIGIINYINYSNAALLKAVKAASKTETKVEEKVVSKKPVKKTNK